MSENEHSFSGNVVTVNGEVKDIKLNDMSALAKAIEQEKTPSQTGQEERDPTLTANKDVMNESTAKQSNIEQSSTIASGIQGDPAENISSEEVLKQDPSKKPTDMHGGKRRTRGRKSSRRKQKGSSRRNRRKSNKGKRRNKK